MPVVRHEPQIVELARPAVRLAVARRALEIIQRDGWTQHVQHKDVNGKARHSLDGAVWVAVLEEGLHDPLGEALLSAFVLSDLRVVTGLPIWHWNDSVAVFQEDAECVLEATIKRLEREVSGE